jgi:hypothetical protein
MIFNMGEGKKKRPRKHTRFTRQFVASAAASGHAGAISNYNAGLGRASPGSSFFFFHPRIS